MKKLFSLLLVLAVALSSAGAMGEALPAPTLFTPAPMKRKLRASAAWCRSA